VLKIKAFIIFCSLFVCCHSQKGSLDVLLTQLFEKHLNNLKPSGYNEKCIYHKDVDGNLLEFKDPFGDLESQFRLELKVISDFLLLNEIAASADNVSSMCDITVNNFFKELVDEQSVEFRSTENKIYETTKISEEEESRLKKCRIFNKGCRQSIKRFNSRNPRFYFGNF